MDQKSVEEIIRQYERNGWGLRRVLITPARSGEFSSLSALGVPVNAAAELDALWFSRARADGRVAWEIRHLSDLPYAIVEVLDGMIDDDNLEKALSSAEQKMKEALFRRMGK